MLKRPKLETGHTSASIAARKCTSTASYIFMFWHSAVNHYERFHFSETCFWPCSIKKWKEMHIATKDVRLLARLPVCVLVRSGLNQISANFYGLRICNFCTRLYSVVNRKTVQFFHHRANLKSHQPLTIISMRTPLRHVGNDVTAPLIHNLGTRWRSSVSRPGRFTPSKKSSLRNE